jgi:chromate transporter
MSLKSLAPRKMSSSETAFDGSVVEARLPDSSSESTPVPAFRQALRFWLKLGLISFGGPAGQIAIMHRELVEKKRWMDEKHFMNGLNFCMFLPGPEAQQLATYLGWRLHGAKGGIAAGTLFVLPSAMLLFALSCAYVAGDKLPWMNAVFHGLSGAVIAIVLEAVLRIGRRALRSPSLVALAVFSFVAIFFFDADFIFIVFTAGMIGCLGHRLLPGQFPPGRSHSITSNPDSPPSIILPASPLATWKRSVVVMAVALPLWWGPIVGLGFSLGWDSTPAQQGFFFSKAALVTFGGAYSVLPYVGQQAVEYYQWLNPTQMMAGLALAETTPGPLIIVLQFVGFLAGWQHPGALDPWMAALIGSVITTWVTFLPSFFFVFLGAPCVERIGDFPGLSASLVAITACVVGVILNLGAVFSMAALWPADGSFDTFVAVVAVLSFFALRTLKMPLVPLIAAAALAGLAWSSVS